MHGTTRTIVVPVLISVGLALACHDATSPGAAASASAAAVLQIFVATSGPDPDTDGYFVTVDNTFRYALAPNTSFGALSLPAGSHSLHLDGIASNCQADGGADRRVTVAPAQRTTVSFSVACIARVGGIAVSTGTTGADMPAGDYRLDVDGAAGRPVAPNDAVTLLGVHEGAHLLTLRNVPNNCTVLETNPRNVAVTFGETTTAAFTVACAVSGIVQITTATTTSGSDPDPDGYTLRMERGAIGISAHVPARGTVSMPFATGSYTISLKGVASNCSVTIAPAAVGGMTQQVVVSAGSTVAVSFAVACAPTPIAFVRGGQIHRISPDGTGLVRLTTGFVDEDPAWSPDGTRIAFARRSGRVDEWKQELRDIYIVNADGSNVVSRTRAYDNYQPTWSPDGKNIAFSRFVPYTGVDIYTMSADDDGRDPVNLTREQGWDAYAAWSPDGTRIAFTSDRAAYDLTNDIFVTSPDGLVVTQLTKGFGFNGPSIEYYQSAWSPDGRTLAVVTCRQQFFTCAVSAVAVMNADGSEVRTLAQTNGYARPAWSPDGRTIAYTLGRDIAWVRADGSARGVIVANGESPSWRR